MKGNKLACTEQRDRHLCTQHTSAFFLWLLLRVAWGERQHKAMVAFLGGYLFIYLFIFLPHLTTSLGEWWAAVCAPEDSFGHLVVSTSETIAMLHTEQERRKRLNFFPSILQFNCLIG